MKLQALTRLTMRCRDVKGKEIRGVERGDLFVADNEDDAKSLVERGLAQPVGTAKGPAKNKAAQSPLGGGPTGAGKPSSSSPRDRAPSTRLSKRAAAARSLSS